MITGPALAAAAVVAACAAGGPPGSGETAAPISFEIILDETTSGLHERLREVVRDEARWAQLWERIHEGVTPRPPLPPVDFSRHMLIAAATGTRLTGGFDVAIRTVTARADRLEVEVFESCPAPGARVSMGLTQPVEVVRLEKLTQAPIFRETKAPSCK
jgi:hypothetical protein